MLAVAKGVIKEVTRTANEQLHSKCLAVSSLVIPCAYKSSLIQTTSVSRLLITQHEL